MKISESEALCKQGGGELNSGGFEMAKNVDPTISGAAWIAGFITDLFTGVAMHGGTEEDVHRLTTPAGRMQLDSICKQVTSWNPASLIEESDPECIADTIEKDFAKIEPAHYSYHLLRNNNAIPKLLFDKLDLLDLHDNEEMFVTGHDFLLRADKAGAYLGQLHAEWILKNQDLIPQEWADFHIMFCGTIWRDAYGFSHVPCLLRDNSGQWYFHLMNLNDKCIHHFRVIQVLE